MIAPRTTLLGICMVFACGGIEIEPLNSQAHGKADEGWAGYPIDSWYACDARQKHTSRCREKTGFYRDDDPDNPIATRVRYWVTEQNGKRYALQSEEDCAKCRASLLVGTDWVKAWLRHGTCLEPKGSLECFRKREVIDDPDNPEAFWVWTMPRCGPESVFESKTQCQAFAIVAEAGVFD